VTSPAGSRLIESSVCNPQILHLLLERHNSVQDVLCIHDSKIIRRRGQFDVLEHLAWIGPMQL
jgi:hypothetical protein